MYKVLVTGDRDWKCVPCVESTLVNVYNQSLRSREVQRPQDMMLIHGAARGADSIAMGVAHSLLMATHAYPADWKKMGRAAGPIRNRLMLDENPDIMRVIAFHNNLLESRGTADMVKYARSQGYQVTQIICSHETEVVVY